MMISEQQGITQSDIFDFWADRVDLARKAQERIQGILPKGKTLINNVKVEVMIKGDYYWLLINDKKVNAWHKGYVDEYGFTCLAWEMAKSYALTWRSVRG